MAVQKPLVLINGEISQLPAGDTISGVSGTATLPQFYDTDPVSPAAGTTWVRANTVLQAGSPIGLLLALTQANTTYSYQLKYRTAENTTVGVALN